MLKLPAVKTTKNPPQIIKDPNMALLHTALQKTEAQPNIITLDVFREFEPLFRRNNQLSKAQVKDLTQKYTKLVDFYKETQIIVSSTNPKVVLTLPSIFTPVRSLEPNERNGSLVATNSKLSHSNVPKYSSDAFANMFTALRNEQSKNVTVIAEYKERFVTLVQDFFEKYSKNAATKEPALPGITVAEEDAPSMGVDTTWDVD